MTEWNAPGAAGEQSPGASGAGPSSGPPSDGEQPRVVIRDKCKLDPQTGDVRSNPVPETTVPEATVPDAAGPDKPDVAGPASPRPTDTGASDTAALMEIELAERTADLQRVSAEYANYRRRVDRDRAVLGEMAQERILADLLPVLDDIDRAEAHGDLTGGFKNVADSLRAVLDKSGVTAFGEVGDPFDPQVHEAVAHSTSPDVTEPTCVAIMRRGYKRGDRVLRTAMVAVADPE